MKKIGLIGGLSWVSTAEYYRRINEIAQEALGGAASARLILESVNRQEYSDAESANDNEAACQILLDAAKSIERGGAAFIAMTFNGGHRFVPEIQPHISIPFLHIAQASADAIKSAGIKSVGLLGVRNTMEGSFYPEILKQHGIATIIPNEEEKTFIHETIINELVENDFRKSTRDRYISIIRALRSRGAHGVILGCTEIPLLLSEGDVDVKTFSTTELHCKAAVKLAIEE